MNKSVFSFMLLLLTFMFTGCTSNSNNDLNVDEIQTGDLQNIESNLDYLVLVNKQHKLPEDWESNLDLVETKNAFDETIKVEKEAYEKYLELRDDLLMNGVDIELDSVYRPVSKQEEIWKEFEEKYGIDYTKKYVAIPGYSEHHTALAIDICLKKDGELIYENEDMVKETEIFEKVHNKLANYGFILRYLEGKEDITGYGYEPWHLRYVGDVEIAKKIMNNGLTLEEYLGDVDVEEFASFYDDGSVREEGKYINGKKQGIWTTYDDDGNVINEEKYDQGELVVDEE